MLRALTLWAMRASLPISSSGNPASTAACSSSSCFLIAMCCSALQLRQHLNKHSGNLASSHDMHPSQQACGNARFTDMAFWPGGIFVALLCQVTVLCTTGLSWLSS